MSNPLKWYGGKTKIAGWLKSLLPHRIHWHLWRETHFGGGALTLSLDPEGLSEAVNDIDGELMNFWSVMRSRQRFQRFKRRCEATPFGPKMWVESLTPVASLSPGLKWSERSVIAAWKFFVQYRQSRQGNGGSYATPTARLRRGMNENVSAWLSAVDGLSEAHQRLMRIELCQYDAPVFISKYDHERAMFYCDPPYLQSTRTAKHSYGQFEMSEEQHTHLLQALSGIRGRFMLSGYESDLYNDYASTNGWNINRLTVRNSASAAKKKENRVECVWRNYT